MIKLFSFCHHFECLCNAVNCCGSQGITRGRGSRARQSLCKKTGRHLNASWLYWDSSPLSLLFILGVIRPTWMLSESHRQTSWGSGGWFSAQILLLLLNYTVRAWVSVWPQCKFISVSLNEQDKPPISGNSTVTHVMLLINWKQHSYRYMLQGTE